MEALITFIVQTRASTDTYTWTKMCPSNMSHLSKVYNYHETMGAISSWIIMD